MGNYKIVGNPNKTREEAIIDLNRQVETRKNLEARNGLMVEVTGCFVEEDTCDAVFIAYAQYDLFKMSEKVPDPFLIVGSDCITKKGAVKAIEARIRMREGELNTRLEYSGLTIKENLGTGTFQASTRCAPRNFSAQEERLVWKFSSGNTVGGRPSWNRT